MKIFNKFSYFFILLLLSSALLLLSACSQVNPYGHFERVEDLNIARAGHTATLLKDGRVLIAGGESTCFADLRGQPLSDKNIGCNGPLKSLEIYDPKSRKFSLAGNLHEAHEMPNAPLLPDGRVVFIGAPGEHAEIYDPKTGHVTLSGKMLIPRKNHTVTLLKDGNTLIAGGNIARKQGSVTLYAQRTDSAEIFNSKTEKFELTGKMQCKRVLFETVSLPNGKVVLTNGDECGSNGTHTVEIYNPKERKFETTKITLQRRGSGRVILMEDGKLVIIGGSGLGRNAVAAEILDPYRQTVSLSKSMIKVLDRPATVRIGNNSILLFGGVTNGFGSSAFLKSSYLYEPISDNFIEFQDMPERRLDSTATVLNNNNILIVGGQVTSRFSKTADIFIVGKGLKHDKF